MLRRIARTLTNLFGRRRLEQDLHDEVAVYEDLLAAEQQAAGKSPDQARRAARLSLEGIDHVKESVRDVQSGAALGELGRDLRYAVRTLVRTPGFTIFTLLTFATAIGGLTVIFTLVNAVLLQPLPYPESDRLVMVLEADAIDPVGGHSVAAPNFQDWRRRNRVFRQMALYEYMSVNLGDAPEPEQVGALRVSGGVFELLGVRPLLGRGLLPADDSVGHQVVVLSHRLWQRRYQSDSSIVGTGIRINNAAWQVIGVMPEGFAFPNTGQQLWVPVHLNQEDQGRASHSFWSVARLADGVTLEQARAELRAIGDQLAAEYPATNVDETANVFPMRDLWVKDAGGILRTLLAAVSLVLLIASANIATLFLARYSTRRREIAARMALGGSRVRIVRQLITESVVLALAGAALGLGLAVSGTRALLSVFPSGFRNLPFRDLSAVSVDLTVFSVAVLAALATGVLAGLAPALTTLPDEPAEALRDAGGRSGTARRGRRLKSVLIGVEVALALVVLAGAGLLIASTRRVLRVDPGLDPADVTAVDLSLPQADFYGPAERATFCQDVERELGGVPGVVAVSAVSHVPFWGGRAGRSFVVEALPDPGPANLPSAGYGVACPGYFGTMRIPMVSGRDFTGEDRAGAPPVIIVNSAFARRWLPQGSAVGRRIKQGRYETDGPWITIVGVAGDVRHNGLTEAAEPYFYAPYAQAAWPRMTVVVRAASEKAGVAGPVRQALRRANPGEPIGEVRTMGQVVESSLGHLRFPMVLFTIFAGLALALTALGCFGVASQTVVQRRRELGIRMALGARTTHLYRMVIGQTMAPVAWGLVAGVVGALAFTGLLRRLLYDIRPNDPGTLALGAAVLAVATVVACLLPARRATRVDPALVLRDD
jgi:putative ABC transport system permease protein